MGHCKMGTYDTGLDDNAGEFVFTLTPVRQIEPTPAAVNCHR